MSPKSDDSFNNFDTAESQNLLSDPSSDFQPDPSSVHKQCTCGNASFMKWTAIFIGVCTLANLVLGFIPVKSVACHDELASISRTQLGQLHRPSPYIGLSQIDRTNSTPPAPILNFPHVIAQVDKSRPTKVFDDDPLRYMSVSGTVSPQKHEVRVKDSVVSAHFTSMIRADLDSVALRFPLCSSSELSIMAWRTVNLSSNFRAKTQHHRHLIFTSWTPLGTSTPRSFHTRLAPGGYLNWTPLASARMAFTGVITILVLGTSLWPSS